jgi:hypothetical protein
MGCFQTFAQRCLVLAWLIWPALSFATMKAPPSYVDDDASRRFFEKLRNDFSGKNRPKSEACNSPEQAKAYLAGFDSAISGTSYIPTLGLIDPVHFGPYSSDQQKRACEAGEFRSCCVMGFLAGDQALQDAIASTPSEADTSMVCTQQMNNGATVGARFCKNEYGLEPPTGQPTRLMDAASAADSGEKVDCSEEVRQRRATLQGWLSYLKSHSLSAYSLTSNASPLYSSLLLSSPISPAAAVSFSSNNGTLLESVQALGQPVSNRTDSQPNLSLTNVATGSFGLSQKFSLFSRVSSTEIFNAAEIAQTESQIEALPQAICQVGHQTPPIDPHFQGCFASGFSRAIREFIPGCSRAILEQTFGKNDEARKQSERLEELYLGSSPSSSPRTAQPAHPPGSTSQGSAK